ncbi:STAS domain-containing protein [Nocardia farcinica]|uniref:STAS domain-containing protein n=1 Tax=Nocardia farcinica TaxID=37329 RepID=UPI0024568846|nr:STAS domain-containing protein [Nocardia farcinica]
MSVDATISSNHDADPRSPGGRVCAQRVEHRHRCVVIRIEGELDALAQHRFHETLDRATHSDCHAVVVDLRAARFLSIRAAAMLGTVRGEAARHGVDLRVVTGRREIERSLEITGVRSQFPRYPSMRAAMEV